MKKGGMGGRKGDMMYSRGYGVGEKSKRRPTMLKDRGPRKYALGALALAAAQKNYLIRKNLQLQLLEQVWVAWLQN